MNIFDTVLNDIADIAAITGQIAGWTARPDSPRRTEALAELGAQLTAAQAVLVADQATARADLDAGGNLDLQDGVYIGINKLDPLRPIINYNGPVPTNTGRSWRFYDFDLAYFNALVGQDVDVTIDDIPAGTLVANCIVWNVDGLQDGGGHSYGATAQVGTPGVVNQFGSAQISIPCNESYTYNNNQGNAAEILSFGATTPLRVHWHYNGVFGTTLLSQGHVRIAVELVTPPFP
jgi:hypothetical protein